MTRRVQAGFFDVATWFTDDEDGRGRVHIEVNDRECASCTPDEAIAVIHVLQSFLDHEETKAVVFEIPRNEGAN
jgi:hypothetical protein